MIEFMDPASCPMIVAMVGFTTVVARWMGASAEDPALQYCPTYGMVMVEYDFIRELPCNRLPKVGCFDDGQ